MDGRPRLGWGDIGRSLLRVFVLPASLVGALAVFVHNLARGLLDATLPVLAVQQLGWTDTAYSELYAAANLAAGIIGMIFGGWLVDRLGSRPSIVIGSLLLERLDATTGSEELLQGPRPLTSGWAPHDAPRFHHPGFGTSSFKRKY